jgi:hypothetical protein
MLTPGRFACEVPAPPIDKARARTYLEEQLAQVAELVDALASGASDRKVVEVRVFSWAPRFALTGTAWHSHV